MQLGSITVLAIDAFAVLAAENACAEADAVVLLAVRVGALAPLGRLLGCRALCREGVGLLDLCHRDRGLDLLLVGLVVEAVDAVAVHAIGPGVEALAVQLDAPAVLAFAPLSRGCRGCCAVL